MRMRRMRWVAAVFALALVATACGGDSGDDTTTDDTADDTGTDTGDDGGATTGDDGGDDTATTDSDILVVGATEEPGHLDPARVYELFGSNILFNTTNRLVEFPAGETQVGPGLATDWDISDDGLTYTFTLREGVTFHDGSAFDSEDVVYSLNRSLNINHPDGASFLLAGIDSVEATGPYEVVITLSEPNVTFLSRLNYTVASILPSDSDVYDAPDSQLEGEDGGPPPAEEADSYLNDAEIVGTGPYQLTEFRPGESITLERFDDYWGDTANIQTVKIQFFDSSAQMKNALENGEIDLNLNEMQPAERLALQDTDGVTVFKGPGARIRYIVLDPTQAPFDDPAVRRSMSAAIDRQRIIDEVFEGAGTPLYSMVPTGFDSYADYMSDLEVEITEPVDITLWYPLNKYGDTEPDVAETIARSLEETGLFNVTTESADWASEYAENLSNHVYAAYMLGWYPDYFDPDDYIEPFYSAESGFIRYYESDEMEQLISDEQQETDTAARIDVFDQIQQLAAQDMPFIPLYEEAPFVYYRDNLTGVETTMDAVQQFRYWLIDKQ